MSMREKNQSDIDVETLIDLFDTALSSNNPAVKKALKNLLLVSTLVESELSPQEKIKGPLRQTINDMRDVSRRLDQLENRMNAAQYSYNPTYTTTGTTSPISDTVLPTISLDVNSINITSQDLFTSMSDNLVAGISNSTVTGLYNTTTK